MSIPLEAIVGDLHIVGGVRQPTSTPTAAFQPPRRVARGRAGDRLFVLVELRPPDLGPAIEVYAPYSTVIEKAANAYWNTEGSVTAALRAGISAANDWLLEHNLNTPVPERFRAGITCMAMRESDVFIAQAGPAACYVAHQGHVERFPSRDVTPVALGASRGVEIRYSHAELHHGDVVLLCDSATAERATDETISQAIVYVGVHAALAALEQMAGSGDLVAMVIEGAAVGTPIRAEPAPSAPPPKPAPPVVEPELPEPDVIPEIARPQEKGPSLPDRLAGWWKRLRQSRAAAQPPAPRAAQAPIPRAALAQRAREIARALLVGLIVAGRNTRSFLKRLMPEPAQEPQRHAPAARLIEAGLAILIPLLVTTLVVYTFTQRRHQAEFDSILNAARAEAAQAQAALNERDARAKWQTALRRADDALSYQPDSAEALAVRNQAVTQLDRLERVTRVKPALLFDFGAGAGYRLVAQGADVFVMNVKNLWHLTLNETGAGLPANNAAPVIVYAGTSVSNRQVGELLDMAWVRADGLRTKSSLVVLDAGGLMDYDPVWSIHTVPLGQGEARPGLRLMATFGGNVYILDNSQLWRYKPVGDGFGTAPEPYFNALPGDLSAVTDLAIDGSIYLLYADGRIRKFFGGNEQPFTLAGLADALLRPVALVADTEATRGSLYVADAGNARIAQFNTQGSFIRQIKTFDGTMNALESIAIDERTQRLFFLSGGKLYSATLPPAQTP